MNNKNKENIDQPQPIYFPESLGKIAMIREYFEIKEDYQLIELIAAIEKYFSARGEEGEATIRFNIDSFPPEKMPIDSDGFILEYTNSLKFRFDPLDEKAEAAINPFKIHDKTNYYLIGKVAADGDQILPFLADAIDINSDFKILSIESIPQSFEDWKYQFPSFLLNAVRGDTASLEIILSTGSTPKKYNVNQAKALKIVKESYDKFKEAYATANKKYAGFGDVY